MEYIAEIFQRFFFLEIVRNISRFSVTTTTKFLNMFHNKKLFQYIRKDFSDFGNGAKDFQEYFRNS